MDENELLQDKPTDFEFSLFERASSVDQDPVLTVLRVHLLTEYYLERVIQICLPRGDRVLDGGNFTYVQKLVLVSSFDVIQDKIIQCLKGLNKVRNQCAHGIDKQISMTEVDTIGRPLGKVCTEYRRKSGDSVPTFLHCIVSYLCGFLASQVTNLEDKKVEEGSQA